MRGSPNARHVLLPTPPINYSRNTSETLPTTSFLNDTFTAADGTLLTAHTSESGHTWSKISGTGAGTIQSGRLYISPSSQTDYRSSAAPSSADYEVTASVHITSELNSGAGIMARVSPSARTYYGMELWRSTTWFALIFKVVAGAFTFFTTPGIADPGAGADVPLLLRVEGNQITATVNGVTYGPFIDSTISAAGTPGVFIDSGTTVAGGTQLDYISAAPANDSLTRLTAVSRSETDTLSTSETTTRSTAASRGPSEGLSLTETPTRATAVSRTDTENITLTASPTRSTAVARTNTDSLSFTESPTRATTVGRGPAETLSLSEAPIRATATARTDSESIALTESPGRIMGVARGNTEQVFGEDVYTNLHPNPSVETNLTSWATAYTPASTLTRINTDSVVGSWCCKVDSQANTFGGANILSVQSVPPNPGFTRTYTLIGWVKAPAGKALWWRIQGFVGGTWTYSWDTSFTGTGGWQQVTKTQALSTDVTGLGAQVSAQHNNEAAFTFYVDAVLLKKGSAISYFDGDSNGASWSGTAHASTSSLPILSRVAGASRTITEDPSSLSLYPGVYYPGQVWPSYYDHDVVTRVFGRSRLIQETNLGPQETLPAVGNQFSNPRAANDLFGWQSMIGSSANLFRRADDGYRLGPNRETTCVQLNAAPVNTGSVGNTVAIGMGGPNALGVQAQMIPCSPHQTIFSRAMVKVVSADAACIIRLNHRYLNAAGTSVTITYLTTISSPTQGQWLPIEAWEVIPPNCSYVQSEIWVTNTSLNPSVVRVTDAQVVLGSNGWVPYEIGDQPSSYFISPPVYTNLVSNPSFETDTSFWTTFGNITTFASQTGWASSGTKSARVTTGTSVVTSGVFITNWTAMTVTAGQSYSFQFAVNVLSIGSTSNLRLKITWSTGATQTVAASNGQSGIYTITLEGATAPAGAIWVNMELDISNAAGTVTDFYMDSIMIIQAARITPYFDTTSAPIMHRSPSGMPAPQSQKPQKPARSPFYFGFADNSGPLLYSRTSATQQAQLAQGENANVLRFQVDLGYGGSGIFGGNPNTINWSVYDSTFNALTAAGIKPLPLFIDCPPSWVRSGTTHEVDPTHYADFASVVAQFATRYPNSVGMEIWNEYNSNNGRNTLHDWVTVSDYVTFLSTIYSTVKASSPSMKVVMGGLVSGDVSGTIPMGTYLGQMYAAGLKGNTDAINFHSYPRGPSCSYGLDLQLGHTNNMAKIRAQIAANNDTATPIWITETGITTTDTTTSNYAPYAQPTEADQSNYTAFTYDYFVQQPDVECLCFHTLVSGHSGLSDPETGYGLVNYPSFTKTAGYLELQTKTRPDDTVIETAGGLARTITETVLGTDAAARLLAYVRSKIEIVGGSSSLADRVVGWGRNFIDNVTGTDTTARSETVQRDISDSTPVSDDPSYGRDYARPLLEDLSLSDSVSALLTRLRDIVETVSTSETVSRLTVLFRANTDSVQGDDSVNRSGGTSRTETENIPTTETPTRSITAFRQIAEAVFGTDLTQRLTEVGRAISDSAPASDSTTRGSVTSLRTIVENLATSDIATRLLGIGRHITDAISGTDVVSRGGQAFRDTEDSAPAVDTLSRSGVNKFRTIIEDISGIFDVVRSVFFRGRDDAVVVEIETSKVQIENDARSQVVITEYIDDDALYLDVINPEDQFVANVLEGKDYVHGKFDDLIELDEKIHSVP
jgi:hypothetical protein